MYIKEVTITDFRGKERTVECCFNLTESELVELQYSKRGGFEASAQRMIDEEDHPAILNAYEEVILKAYGEISQDGLHFDKSPEISKRFKCTPMFDQIFMELCTQDDAFDNFMRNVLPDSIQTEEFNKKWAEALAKKGITVSEAAKPEEN